MNRQGSRRVRGQRMGVSTAKKLAISASSDWHPLTTDPHQSCTSTFL